VSLRVELFLGFFIFCLTALQSIMNTSADVILSPPFVSSSAPLRKGEQTRAAILDIALELAAKDGLEGLTIGLLADRMQMSKSGVFAHFGSREDLQVEVVREYHRRFEDEVFYPSLKKPRGLPRLREMLDRWMSKLIVELQAGCILISGTFEFDDREGAVRNELAYSIRLLRVALARAIVQAKDEGHLRVDTEPEMMLYQVYSLVLGLHHDSRFLRQANSIELAKTALTRLIDSYRIQ
jgi:AcrR family transcriptional regulator